MLDKKHKTQTSLVYILGPFSSNSSWIIQNVTLLPLFILLYPSHLLRTKF